MSIEEGRATFKKRAKFYDLAIKLYSLIGIRLDAYRERAVDRLRLAPGHLVVDLACGTGLNFQAIVDRIGPEGRLIGLDLSSEMLNVAEEKVREAGWTNVELVQSDMASFPFPNEVDAVISTGAFGYVVECDEVIRAVRQALVPGGRFVILDCKEPHWPSGLFKLFMWLSKPLGATMDYFDRHPWETVERCFGEFELEEMYGGLVYIASGTAVSST